MISDRFGAKRKAFSVGRFDDRYDPGRVFMKSYFTSGSSDRLIHKRVMCAQTRLSEVGLDKDNGGCEDFSTRGSGC